MLTTVFIISFLFFSPNCVTSLEIPVLTNAQDLIGLAHDIGDLVSGNIPFQSFFVEDHNPLDTVITTINKIADQVGNIDAKLDDFLATILSRIPLEDNINTDMRELQHLIARIDVLYQDFLLYSENLSKYRNDTITEFVFIVTSAKSGNLPDILNKMSLIVVPTKSALNRQSILQMLLHQRNVSNPLELCNLEISFQHRLLQIYNLILITEMKALLMTSFAYKIINEWKNVTSTGEIEKARSGFIMRSDQYLLEFKTIMLKASREIFLCDPLTNVLGKNYLEFEGLFTAYVMNEFEIGMDPCSTSCPEIWTWQHHRCYKLYDQHYCPEHPCKGLIRDCGWIGGDVDICEFPPESRKRYDWVRSYTNGWYGQYTHCENGTYKQVNGARQHWYSCDMCICRCEESWGSSRAIRTFSLQPQITNIAENKVVSDVQFVLKDKMIHIQIEESPLSEIGQLNKSASAWIPLKDFIYLSNSTGGDFVQVEDGKYIPLQKDKDFAFISRDQRVLNIDEISGGPNYVLTGVRLNHESQEMSEDGENLSPLQLEIHVTPYNYSTGQLNASDENPSLWLTPKMQPKLPNEYTKDRKELEIGDNVYRYNSVVHSPNVKPNQYVKFQQSSILSDVGQSTIPFIDSRPVAANNFLALDGIGLLHRGKSDYGGFIALKALTIDLTNYMNPTMTKQQINYNKKAYRKPVLNSRFNKKTVFFDGTKGKGSRTRNRGRGIEMEVY